jgi:Domain of unknown function (DUF1906)
MRLLSRGRRWKAALVPLVLLAGLAAPLASIQPASASLPGPVVVHGDGFDYDGLPPTSDMTTWWAATPYWAEGVYIGGENYIGTTPNHAWLANVMTTGWRIWLYWTGPQSACADQTNLASFSNNAATAADQGETQAKDAIAAASADGFANEFIVYDLEAFDTSNSTCLAAAQSFVNGFEFEVHAVDGKHGALYGSSCGSDLTAYTAHSNIPEEIFPADYGYSDYATTPIQCIPNNSWNDNQRVHQWSQNTALRINPGHSAPGATIDEDCLDGWVEGVALDNAC